MTQSAFELSSSSPPLQGRYSRLLRGGVGIKGLRSPRRGKSETGPKLKDSNLKPEVPASSRLPSLSLESRTSTHLLGSLARGQGARAPPPPRTQTAVSRDVAALNSANYSARTLTSGATRTRGLGAIGGVKKKKKKKKKGETVGFGAASCRGVPQNFPEAPEPPRCPFAARGVGLVPRSPARGPRRERLEWR